MGQYSMESNYNCSILFNIFQEMASYLAQGKHTNSSEDEQYYFLQPMFEKLPPNQILSEKYSPDVVPQVKLMTNKDERRNNIHYIPPKTKNIELQNYADLFNLFDFLGKQYADKINQIVYLKFNNAKYNLSPEHRLATRIMPAFYIPFQQIYNTNQTYFTKNIGFQFPQTCINCMLPSAKYNRGCSLDPIFCSNYQSGNLFAAVRKNPFEYDLILQNDINSCKSVNWFNFSVQFSQQGYYSFKIVNLTEDMSKIYERGMKISYCYLNPLANKPYKRNGQGWGLCGENIKFSKSTIERQQKKGQTYYELYFQFKCKNKHDIIVFALDVPYNSLDAQAFFNNILFKKIKNMLKIEKKEFGKTISGSPLVSYQISRKKLRGQSIQMTPPQVVQTQFQGKNKRISINLLPINRSINSIVQTHNKSIIILGRMQGADTSGSFIMQGMIDYLLDTIQFQSMKRVFDFYFIPLVNVDAVKYGNTLTNLTGSILNKSWANPHKYYQSEIFCLKELLKEINKDSPISLIINLDTQKQDLYSSVVGVKNDTDDSQDSRIFPFILAKRNKLFSFQKSTFYRKSQNNSMCCVLNEIFTKALIYQLNASHFESIRKTQDSLQGYQTDAQLKQCTPQSYRSLGKDLLSYYLEHVKLYDKNLLLKDKWVKEIQQIQSQIKKKPILYIDELTVEEKFPQAFYQIQNLNAFYTSGVKVNKKVVSNKFLNPPKTFEMDRLQKSLKKQRVFKNTPHSVKDFIGKISHKQTYLKARYQTSNDLKKLQCEDTNAQKPISLFRIGQKKSSILLNCPSNTLNFQLQGQNKFKNKASKEKNVIEKEALKKQLSTKLLKKVKIEDTLKGWKSRDKVHDVKLGQFLNNS